jgi:putative thiamine transport system permease protein
VLIALLWAAPLAAGLVAGLVPAVNTAAWQALMAHPQMWPALALSLFTGTMALALSLALAILMVIGLYQSRLWRWLSPASGMFLALPHLAFAIGFGFLIMPSGVLARVLAQAVTGWPAPPSWVTTQDPLGIALIACLVLKETPFLIWLMWGLLARSDVAQSLGGQWRSARSLGYRPGAVWAHVLLPQLLPRLLWPIVIVWVYGATVVDMALVIGPTQPPTLAVISWLDLNHADAGINRRGAVAAVLLTATLLAIGLIAAGLVWLAAHGLRAVSTRGPSPVAARQRHSSWFAGFPFFAFGLIYAVVFLTLLIMSFALQWPFPHLLPMAVQPNAWLRLLAAPDPAAASLVFSVAATAIALALAILWFETVPKPADRWLTAAAIGALALPALMLASGQYVVFLQLGLTGGVAGVLLAHVMQVFAYVFIVLQGPYRAFDPRFRSVSLGLNASRWRFFWTVKAPLLKPALAAAAAVGVADGVAQNVPIHHLASRPK